MTRTEFALNFLAKRNPFSGDTSHSEYVFILMNFQDKKGDVAIESLAGFYIWAIDNLKGEKCTNAIRSTFCHDLNGATDKFLEPRSSNYHEFWMKECEKHNL